MELKLKYDQEEAEEKEMEAMLMLLRKRKAEILEKRHELSVKANHIMSSAEEKTACTGECRNMLESIVEDDNSIGTKWAVLVAGSNEWYNYRHQADVCHAYQLLKKGGLKDENIIVFMYDDIAYHPENPRPGVIINSPHGHDVYKGVPKVFYMEACDSGSMFDGLLPKGLNIYVTTASKPNENSWATYCSADGGECLGECPPKDYKDICLGDLFSVSWLEDSDLHNRRVETLKKQYRRIRKRVVNNGTEGSHIMQYGDLYIHKDALSRYMGSDYRKNSSTNNDESWIPSRTHVNQRDVHILYLLSKFRAAPEGSTKKTEAYRKLNEALSQRQHVDNSVRHIGEILFGVENGPEVLKNVRPAGQPLVDDWDCLKSFVKTFESHCGPLSSFSRKHVRGFANMCNAGIHKDQMAAATKQACSP
ncbi:hypothetical protein RND71_039245 [Anisodus tanguticus]|uniref:Legumain prodomain domain-containing protein n=1 Tax=Anisodus tanguticus TaxID=243964 RepID=A0AAE1QWZ4_9SOLA|nr:hypothetical protein RND71_039245 [Anisodus tanguticus]